MFIACRLAKEGYFNGNPEEVLKARADIVQSVLEYGNFTEDYEKQYIALNKE